MKSKAFRICLIAVLSALIYLLLMVLGALIICYYPVYGQSSYTVREAQAIAQAPEADLDEAITDAQTANIYVLVYDLFGNLERYEVPSNNLYGIEPTWDTEKQLAKVLAGNDSTQVFVTRLTDHWYPDFLVISGVPIESDGFITGAVFVGKDLMDVPYSIFGFLLYFTCCYWITVSVILYTRSRRKRLAQLEKNLMANMTHELKTPTASIKALAETLCDGVEPDPDKQQLYYGMILQEANHQSRMIQDILDLSKLQNDTSHISCKSISAKDLFNPVWEKYELLLDCSEIKLHRSSNLDNLPDLETNPEYIRQIMEIILDNALKFVPEGGDVWVDASVARHKAIISVRDNGCGISHQDLPYIFMRFYKSSQSPDQSGTGLGLAMAKEICDRLQERIWAETPSDKGAVFYFTIHLAQ